MTEPNSLGWMLHDLDLHSRIVCFDAFRKSFRSLSVRITYYELCSISPVFSEEVLSHIAAHLPQTDEPNRLRSRCMGLLRQVPSPKLVLPGEARSSAQNESRAHGGAGKGSKENVDPRMVMGRT